MASIKSPIGGEECPMFVGAFEVFYPEKKKEYYERVIGRGMRQDTFLLRVMINIHEHLHA